MLFTGRRVLVSVLCALLVEVPFSAAQQQNAAAPRSNPPPATTGAKFVLDDGTPIKLRLNRNLSSADAKTGDSIDFEVVEDVKVNDMVVIPKGSIAIGTVTDAEHKKRMARGGKLNVEIDYVKLADGEKDTLRAVKETSGGGHTGAMTAGIVVTALIVWPAAPFFLFMHGKDVTIPKGTEITAYTNGVMELDPAKFAPTPPAASAVATAATSDSASGHLEITSNPTGAEISIDGNFVGDTPSETNVPTGSHTVTIAKKGYKTWERKLAVSGGKITVAADLEQQ
jgi:hypothetical protein